MKNFALIGAAGYIAPRHMRAIKDTGNQIVAALDPSDSVGVMDSYFPNADFFTEFERFDRHLEKLRRKGQKVDYVTICSPNYLHDAHVRFALRIGAEAICEKPMVLNPWNATALGDIEKEVSGKINTIQQLRLHPSIVELKKQIDQSDPDKPYDVELTYIAPRGNWYMTSWKGDPNKSGGITNNIGIHFFDMLLWIFGQVKLNAVNLYEPKRAAGILELQKATVRWYLSLQSSDLTHVPAKDNSSTYRSITVNGKEIEFSTGFTDLHTESYKQILAGNGFGVNDVMPSIELTSAIRNSEPVGPEGKCHPILKDINTEGF